MTKQQKTKSQRLEELFGDARISLPNYFFCGWLAFCFGIMGNAVGMNRKISKYDVTLIAMELDRLKKECGYIDIVSDRHFDRAIALKEG